MAGTGQSFMYVRPLTFSEHSEILEYTKPRRSPIRTQIPQTQTDPNRGLSLHKKGARALPHTPCQVPYALPAGSATEVCFEVQAPASTGGGCACFALDYFTRAKPRQRPHASARVQQASGAWYDRHGAKGGRGRRSQLASAYAAGGQPAAAASVWWDIRTYADVAQWSGRMDPPSCVEEPQLALFMG